MRTKHIHLIGICGTAMASLAGMLRARGHRVTGSDTAAYPPMSDQLRAMGIAILEPYRPENLDPRPDLVVVGNHGMTGRARFLLGSIPNKVAHHCRCSVLIANTDTETDTGTD